MKKLKVGDKVIIGKRVRTLVRSLEPRIKGGWELNKPLEGFRYWNEDAMHFEPISILPPSLRKA